MPKAATRTRRKKNSDSEDEDYVAAEEEVSSKKKVVKKEFGIAASTKPGLNKKAPAKRVPMSKARASTLESSKLTVGERSNFKNFLRTCNIMVMHSNERGECRLRTLVDRKWKC